MSAIAGILDLDTGEEAVERMIKTMRLRGRVGADYYRERETCLVQSRSKAAAPQDTQPMALWDGDEEYVAVLDGKLYNSGDICKGLEKLGHSFHGRTDAELLLHAYAQWGEDCLERLDGTFAFALWDVKRKRLFMARDRLGVKPFFYKEHRGGLLFASEIKTILSYPTVKPELTEEGAAQILLLGPGRSPGSGVFRGIRELEPGWCGNYESGRLTLRQYWRLRDREHRESFEETAETVRRLVMNSILRQSAGEENMGAFLSGGLDSSLVTAVCAQRKADCGGVLKTFSVDYEDSDKYFVPNKFQPNSDGYYIRLMENAVHTDHHWCVLSPEQLVNTLEEAVYARDLPGMADVDASLLAFCRYVKVYTDTVLSGECADEIFGGYPWYRDPEIRSREGFPWAQNTAQRIALLNPHLRSRINCEEFVADEYQKTIRESDILPGTSREETRMKEMMNLNLRWFMQTLLDRSDRMSMYAGLEIRVPFCDYRIAEYLYGVPWEYKDYQGKEKGLLRMAMADLLPKEVAWRKKSPYPKTFDPAYENAVRTRLTKLLETDAPLFALVDRKEAQQILTRDDPWPWYGQLMRRPQIIAYLLQINAWMEHYSVNLVY